MDFNDKPFIPRNEHWELFFSFLYGMWFIVKIAFFPFLIFFIPSYCSGRFILKKKKPWITYLITTILGLTFFLFFLVLKVYEPKVSDIHRNISILGILSGMFWGMGCGYSFTGNTSQIKEDTSLKQPENLNKDRR